MTRRGLITNENDVAVTGRQELNAAVRQAMEAFIDELAGVPERWLDMPLTWGFSIVAEEGGFTLHPFGSSLDPGDLKDGWRSPAIRSRVDEGRRRIEVAVELPGVDKQDVQLDVGPDHIRLEAEGPDVRYKSLYELGMHVDPGRAEATCQDGMLRIEAPLKPPHPSRVRHIQIE